MPSAGLTRPSARVARASSSPSRRKKAQSKSRSKAARSSGAACQAAAAPRTTPYQVFSKSASPSSSHSVFITPRTPARWPSRTKFVMLTDAISVFGKIWFQLETPGQTNCSRPAFLKSWMRASKLGCAPYDQFIATMSRGTPGRSSGWLSAMSPQNIRRRL
jgi:hypothetical protein